MKVEKACEGAGVVLKKSPPAYQNPPEILELPAVPPEIAALFSLGNHDLSIRHWGMALGFWLMQPLFPLHTSVVQKNLNLSRWTFWPLVDDLVDRKIIWLRFGQKSHWFQAFFVHVGKPHMRVLHGGKSHMSLMGEKATCEPLMGEKATCEPLMGEKSPVGVGVYIKQTPTTPADIKTILQGAPLEWCKTHFQNFDPGELLPVFQDAKALNPEDPAGLFLGALGYLAKSMSEGFKPRNLTAKLRSNVQKGWVLTQWPELSKKRPPNQKKEETYFEKAARWKREQENPPEVPLD